MYKEMMKYSYIQISDYPLLKTDIKLLYPQKEFSTLYQSLEELAEILKKQYSTVTTDSIIPKILRNNNLEIIFVINCEGLFLEKNRSAFEGIKFLKWLRLKGINNHCVLVSFYPFEALLKYSVKNNIIATKGVSYFQLGEDLEKIGAYFNGIEHVEHAVPAELSQCLKSHYSFESIEHTIANWWALKSLFEVYNLLHKGKQIPEGAIKLQNVSQDNIAEFEIAYYIHATDHKLSKTDHPNTTALPRLSVLLIDDHAENGWENLYRHFFSNGSHIPDIKSISIGTSDTVQSIESNIVNFLKEFAPDFILLDLRLLSKERISRITFDITELSGARILDFLQLQYPEYPIVITTASNKVWTYQKLISIGADAYWIKPSLEYDSNLDQVYNHYIQIVELVNRICGGPYYASLRELVQFYKNLDNETGFWWDINKGNLWQNGDKVAGNTSLIKDVLESSIKVYKRYLHDYYLGYGLANKVSERFVIAGLLNKLGGIFEAIHNIDSEDSKYKNEIITLRDPDNKIISTLRELRNKGSHFKADYFSISIIDFFQCIDATKVYLKKIPTFKNEEDLYVIKKANFQVNYLTVNIGLKHLGYIEISQIKNTYKPKFSDKNERNNILNLLKFPISKAKEPTVKINEQIFYKCDYVKLNELLKNILETKAY